MRNTTSSGRANDVVRSPSFLTAANFIVLGRTISYTNGQQYARLSPRKCTCFPCVRLALRNVGPNGPATLVTWLFLSFDILCLFIQSAGGGIASTTNVQQAKVGSDIALVGIAAQTGERSSLLFPSPLVFLPLRSMPPPIIAAIAMYTLVAADFIWRLHANKPLRKAAGGENSELASRNTSVDGVVLSPPGVPNRIPGNIQLMFAGLGISTLFLLIRAIYRLIEVRTSPVLEYPTDLTCYMMYNTVRRWLGRSHTIDRDLFQCSRWRKCRRCYVRDQHSTSRMAFASQTFLVILI